MGGIAGSDFRHISVAALRELLNQLPDDVRVSAQNTLADTGALLLWDAAAEQPLGYIDVLSEEIRLIEEEE